MNYVLTTVAESAMHPLSKWPLASLLVWSALTGVLMTWVFRYASNQKALSSVVDRSRGHLLAIKLFKDDLSGMFSSLFHVIRLALARLWYSVIPVMVMLVPLLFLLVQLALRYEYRPLEPGEPAIVELQLTPEGWASHQGAHLKPTDHSVVEAGPLRDALEHTVSWRIRPLESGSFNLQWELGSANYEKQFVTSNENALCQVSQRRPGQNWFDRLLNPGEPALAPASPVSSIAIGYPHRDTPLFGWSIPWWLSFFVVSVAMALLMQPVFKVKF